MNCPRLSCRAQQASIWPSAVSVVGSMKTIFSAAWLSICLLTTVLPVSVMAATVPDKPATDSAQTAPKKPVATKKTAPATKKAAAVKKRAPIASKSKPASEVAKTRLPAAKLDLRLPPELVKDMKPVGTVQLPRHDAVLPQMFGEKSSPFQLNGRLLSNEMQLQLRNEERRDVEGAALDFEFKQ